MLISGVYIFIKNHATSGNNFFPYVVHDRAEKVFFFTLKCMGNTNEEGKIFDILGKMY